MSRQYGVTVADEDGEWLDNHPRLGPSGLLQKAIHEAQQKAGEDPNSIEDLVSLSPEDAAWIDDQPIDLTTFVQAMIAEQRRAGDETTQE